MTHRRIVGLALALTLGGAVPALAQVPAAPVGDPLVLELRGATPSPARTPEQWKTAFAQALASLLPDMGADDLEKQAASQDSWERIVLRAGRPGAEAERAAVTAVMLEKTGPQTPAPARLWLIKQIGNVGRAEAVAPLTALIDDTDATVRDRALRALVANPTPDAAQALRGALAKASGPTVQAALVNALGHRRDAAAVPAIAKLTASADPGVQAAAIAALGRIGGADAVKALAAVKPATPVVARLVADASLAAANGYLAQGRKADAAPIYARYAAATQPKIVRMGALRGLVLARGAAAVSDLGTAMGGKDEQMAIYAARLSAEIPGAQTTAALASLLPKLPEPARIALIEELDRRTDTGARAAVLTMTKSPSEPIRIAAFRALGGVGIPADAALLAKTAAAAAPESNAARESLARLRGAGVDDALIAAAKTGETPVRIEYIHAIGLRRPAAGGPALLALASDADANVRVESIKALGVAGDDASLPGVLTVLTGATADDQREAAQRAMLAIAGRSGNRAGISKTVLTAYNGAAAPLRRSLLPILAVTGGDDALTAVRAGVKDSDPGVKDAAIRTLAAWQDPAVTGDLLEIARTGESPTHRVLALQGYARLAALGDRKPAERLKLYQDGLGVATRPEEKRQILGSLADVALMDALRTVQPYLGEDNLREEAASAAVKIAKNLRNAPTAEVRPVLEKVVQVSKNGNTLKDANDLLGSRYK